MNEINVNYCLDCDVVDPEIVSCSIGMECRDCGNLIIRLQMTTMELIAIKRLDKLVANHAPKEPETMSWLTRLFRY